MTYTPPKRRKLTRAERAEVYAKYGGHCAYCGEKITQAQMQVDHKIPMELYEAYAAIGQDLDTMDNYMPACRSCNHYKSSMTLEKFRVAIEHSINVLARDSVTYRNAVRFGMVTPNPQIPTFYFERFDLERLKYGNYIPIQCRQSRGETAKAQRNQGSEDFF